MLLEDVRWGAAELGEVRFAHPNKQAVHALAGDPRHGVVRVRRWPAAPPLSVGRPASLQVEVAPGPFAYDDAGWTPNFADHDLFAYWDGPLLAQDELQVLEHPVLGAVRRRLLAEGRSTLLVDADGRPTPFTLEGVPRRCAFDVAELYGNAFARAPVERVRAATRVLSPPTTSRIYAMAAPACGRGRYTTGQIEWILGAATTAFRATREVAPAPVHLGFWGCGAFGGNRVLMALLQLVAASAAGVERVVFHTFDPAGRADLDRARRELARLGERLDDAPSAWVLAVHGLGLTWGVSDGN